MDLKSVIANAATVFTIAVFLAGTEICRKIWLKKSTADISALPFVCGVLNCVLWLSYGLLKGDSALIIVNSTGVTLQTLYLLWYARYAASRGTFYKQVGIIVCIIGFLHFYTTFKATPESAINIYGIASCSAGVIFMGSPLASVAHVLRTKSVEALPFAMILSTFIMATLWLCYGILVNDRFVQVPNFLGALLALCQLCLFAMFPSKKPYYGLETIS